MRAGFSGGVGEMQDAAIVKDVNETLHAAARGRGFSYSWRSGSQIGEVCERVEG